jgi:hypothetical protein
MKVMIMMVMWCCYEGDDYDGYMVDVLADKRRFDSEWMNQ